MLRALFSINAIAVGELGSRKRLENGSQRYCYIAWSGTSRTVLWIRNRQGNCETRTCMDGADSELGGVSG